MGLTASLCTAPIAGGGASPKSILRKRQPPKGKLACHLLNRQPTAIFQNNADWLRHFLVSNGSVSSMAISAATMLL